MLREAAAFVEERMACSIGPSPDRFLRAKIRTSSYDRRWVRAIPIEGGPMLDSKSFRAMSCGVYVIAAQDEDTKAGCIVNTLTQVTSKPARVIVAINKDNFTTGVVLSSGRFEASVLAESAPMELIGRFGFRSSADTDKFSDTEIRIDELKKTPTFFDMGFKLSYDFDFFSSTCLQIYAGMNNLLNAMQSDYDKGADRDSGYIYGPTMPRSAFLGMKLSF